MSYTVILTLTKSAESPANAFETMPVLPTVGTPEQIAAFRQAYPNEWSIERSDSTVKTTSVYASQEVWDAQQTDPLAIAVRAAKDAWAEANHITITIEKI
jgi:hypothetical protein